MDIQFKMATHKRSAKPKSFASHVKKVATKCVGTMTVKAEAKEYLSKDFQDTAKNLLQLVGQEAEHYDKIDTWLVSRVVRRYFQDYKSTCFFDDLWKFVDDTLRRYYAYCASTSKKDSDSETKKRVSVSQHCGLHLPVSDVRKWVKEQKYDKRTAKEVPVFLTAVLEMFMRFRMQRAAEKAQSKGKKSLVVEYFVETAA